MQCSLTSLFTLGITCCAHPATPSLTIYNQDFAVVRDVVPVNLATVSAPVVVAQPTTTSTNRLAFDIISIKPSAPFRPETPLGNDFGLWFGPDSHVILSNVTLHFLIKLSYELRDDQISTGPGWLSEKHFDIDAKCDPPVGGDPRRLSFEGRQAYNKQLFLRIQSLMADRFHLVLREEPKEMPIFDLVVARSGPKFAPSPDVAGPDGKMRRGAEVWAGHIEAYRMNMDVLARMLSNYVGRTVIDRTGLSASYDLKLDWSPDPSDPFGIQNHRDDKPGIFTALQEQLGLKLESAKGSIPFFVVENASLPEAN